MALINKLTSVTREVFRIVHLFTCALQYFSNYLCFLRNREHTLPQLVINLMISKYAESKLSWHAVAMGWSLPNCYLTGKIQGPTLGSRQWGICSLLMLGIKFDRNAIWIINTAPKKTKILGWINKSKTSGSERVVVLCPVLHEPPNSGCCSARGDRRGSDDDGLQLRSYVHTSLFTLSEETKHLSGAWKLFEYLKVCYLEARFMYK